MPRLFLLPMQEMDSTKMLEPKFTTWHQILLAISFLKSISKDGGRGSYRGMAKIMPKAENCRLNIVCDALILDEESR